MRRTWSDSLKIKCICEVYGKEFYVYPSVIKIGGGKYCSRKCNNESQKIEIILKCEFCGKEFKTIPSKINNGTMRYCSRDCYYKSKGKKVIIRKCLKCGRRNESGKGFAIPLFSSMESTKKLLSEKKY